MREKSAEEAGPVSSGDRRKSGSGGGRRGSNEVTSVKTPRGQRDSEASCCQAENIMPCVQNSFDGGQKDCVSFHEAKEKTHINSVIIGHVVQDAYKIDGTGTVPVETAVLNPQHGGHLAPASDTNEVQSLGMHHEALREALPGDSVGFSVEKVSIKDVCHGTILMVTVTMTYRWKQLTS
ncbi:hypothetical protein R6Z07M_001181 [Ovis aries]